MENNREKKKKNRIYNVLIVIIVCVLIACGANFLLTAYKYHNSERINGQIRDDFSSPVKEEEDNELISDDASSKTADRDEKARQDTKEDDKKTSSVKEGTKLKAPVRVDFAALKAVNEDVIGWIYVEAFPEISFPIMQGADNDYYLYHTIYKEDLFSGSIFADSENAGDFTDMNTILYGHNMKDLSMFGKLRYFRQAETLKANPYFWILTPDKVEKYEIFTIADTDITSAAYNILKAPCPEFTGLIQELKALSVTPNDCIPDPEDKIIVLSTCTNATGPARTLICGTCIFSESNTFSDKKAETVHNISKEV